MKFPWSRSEPGGGVSGRAGTDVESAPQSCPSLSKALEKILRNERPEILDLGPFCGATAVFLADRGARVSVAEFEPPPPLPAGDEEAATPPPIRVDQPDRSFDLVLVWEAVDFVPPARLGEFCSELERLLVDGGWALLLSLARPPERGPTARRPPRYRVVADGRVLREPSDGPSMRRYGHPTREVERALAPLVVSGIHLQRSQMREFLVSKRSG